jgi:hypothetical protein
MARFVNPVLLGTAEMRSRFGSNEWRLVQNDAVVATARRLARAYASAVRLESGEIWILEPEEWGIVVARRDDDVIGRIERRSWLGRRWEVSGVGFAYDLVSRAAPRRWFLGVGGAPIAELQGSALTYNRFRIESGLSVPLVAVLLSWHVVVRPWEAAAEPRILRSLPAPPVGEGESGSVDS